MIGLRLFLPESWTGAPTGWRRPACPRTGGRRGRSRSRAGRDRPHPRRWRSVCDGVGGCRLWPVRAVPPRARRATPEVGGRNPPSSRKSIRAMSGWCFRSPDAGGRASAIFPISSPRRLKTFSPPQSGDASAGVKEPKGFWRPPSPRCACGSPMVCHNASMTRACSTCQARRPGWSASVAPRASANTIFPTCLPTPTSRRSPPRSRRDGSASRPTSNLRKNLASTTSKADPGMASIATS
jgi:hypothetical protein